MLWEIRAVIFKATYVNQQKIRNNLYPSKALLIKLGHIYTTECCMCSMKMKELEYKKDKSHNVERYITIQNYRKVHRITTIDVKFS